jgi:hypothetical protein
VRDLGSEDFRTLFDLFAGLELAGFAAAIIICPFSLEGTGFPLLMNYRFDLIHIFWMNSLTLVD